MKNKYCFLILTLLFVFIIGSSVVCAADNQTTDNIQKISEKTNIEKQNTISVKEKKNKTITSKKNIKTASKKTTYKTTLNTPKQAEANQKINIKTVTKDNNGKNAAGRILIRYNGKQIARQDIKNGQTSYTYKVPNKLGQNKIQAYYYKAGVLKTTTTKTITITKPVTYKTTLTTPTNPDINQKITIKTVTKDSNGKNAAGRILLRYNGKIITRQDIKNGQTSYTYKVPNKIGQNKIQAYYYKAGVLKTTTTKTIQVTKTIYVSPNGNDKQAGTYKKPYKTIQKAVDKSQNGYTIKLLKGIYTNKNIPKTITINKNINIANNAKDKVTIRITKFQTIIDNRANTKITGINFDRSLDKIIVNRKNMDIINSNFTSNSNFHDAGYDNSTVVNYGIMKIENSIFNNNTAFGGTDGYGGAISSYNGTITIENSKFNNNHVRYYGGAIYLQNSKTIIKNSYFSNQGTDYYGGAIFSEGSTLDIRNSYFYNNHARRGGAISAGDYYLYDDDYGKLIYMNVCTCKIYKCTFDENKVYNYGGALVGAGTIDNGCSNMTITGSIIKNSFSRGGNAGAIYNNGNLTITSTQIINNKATSRTDLEYEDSIDYGNGGAIYSYNGTVTITNSKINNNQAHNGGALTIQNGTLTVTSSQLNNNKATIGGAIATIAPEYEENEVYYQNININNCDINNNYANTSSAIYIMDSIESNCEGTLNIINSRIKNNKCPNLGDPYRGGGSYTLSNSYDVPITIRNTQIINNSADVILGLSDKTIIQNSIIKNNKAGIILDTTSSDAKINKCTIENNKATKSVIYHLIGQSEGTCNITKTNFINNKGLLIKYEDSMNMKHMKIENNYWGSKSPNWSKLLSGVKKPNKYYKTRI